MEVGQEYSSYKESASELQALQKQTKSVFVKSTSTRHNSENFPFNKVLYKCKRGAVPWRYKATTSDRLGLRKSTYLCLCATCRLDSYVKRCLE